uniref:Protein kinase domain-containing protein n=1 Tax=Proboscia inermis TaxID=420281 RepID=A0A7S0GFP8_9STRA|mmetsp:Transcript_36574/g.36845  ORF Transcript_36574/g.36845 Transcript_36574/m.36845 type:complete len:141 (+) Transcript_36574:105-527(+)
MKGRVKIFDFGLSRELDEDDSDKDGTYKLTGCVGSLRYMAPEIALNQSYNNKIDNYAYSMVLWEMLALVQPFENFDVKMHYERVVKGDYRPEIADYLSPVLKKTLKCCWSSHPNDRLTFAELVIALSGEINMPKRGKGLP